MGTTVSGSCAGRGGYLVSYYDTASATLYVRSTALTNGGVVMYVCTGVRVVQRM